MYKYGFGYRIKKLSVNEKNLLLGNVNIKECYGIDDYIGGDILILSIIEATMGIINNRKIMSDFFEFINIKNDCNIGELAKAFNLYLFNNNLKMDRIDSYIVIEDVKMSTYTDAIIDNLSSIFNINKSDICIAATTNDGIGEIGKGKAIEVITMIILKTLCDE